MAISKVGGGTQITHASKTLPDYVGGTTFKTVDAFKNTIGKNGTAILAPGDKMYLPFPAKGLLGARNPEITGFNKSSPFTTQVVTKGGKQYLEVSVKSDAKIGTTDGVKLHSGALVAPSADEKKAFPFTLQVGIGHILMG
ncbi:MAG: hypothetical protein JST54_07715 [Deltaproteobacteria bacterium]|nr:hypothetical protein [Deltaproteobacteria bacterium]